MQGRRDERVKADETRYPRYTHQTREESVSRSDESKACNNDREYMIACVHYGSVCRSSGQR